MALWVSTGAVVHMLVCSVAEVSLRQEMQALGVRPVQLCTIFGFVLSLGLFYVYVMRQHFQEAMFCS